MVFKSTGLIVPSFSYKDFRYKSCTRYCILLKIQNLVYDWIYDKCNSSLYLQMRYKSHYIIISYRKEKRGKMEEELLEVKARHLGHIFNFFLA